MTVEQQQIGSVHESVKDEHAAHAGSVSRPMSRPQCGVTIAVAYWTMPDYYCGN